MEVSDNSESNMNIPAQEDIKPTHNGFSLPMILLGILIIIAVAGGAYYLGTLKNKPQTQNPVVTSQTVPPSPSPISDLTANWKTYINTAYGYQISYPPLKV